MSKIVVTVPYDDVFKDYIFVAKELTFRFDCLDRVLYIDSLDHSVSEAICCDYFNIMYFGEVYDG